MTSSGGVVRVSTRTCSERKGQEARVIKRELRSRRYDYENYSYLLRFPDGWQGWYGQEELERGT